ncbi:LytR family transcriptional regulator [Nocardioides sp. GY 10113]|uniref:LCP family protein n=1 Tax=Nocardioides sp. GY 10113 TaxID=2569761 RepID=UPI0010A80A0F|nr:LCP family protein [Nocardioides sp. GY 10113]TIC84815.1 LytR family transcriptional regulator [Nocardioides sp. GY 10113]
MTDDERPRPGGARRASRSVRVSRADRRRMRHQEVRGGRRALRPDEVVALDPDTATARAKGGRRARRPRQRRVQGLGGTLGMTFLGAVVPGSGYFYTGRRAAGWVVLAGWASVMGLAGWYFGRDWHRAIDVAFDPTALKIAAVVLGTLLALWVGVVWTSYRLLRPRERPRWHTVVGNVSVLLICLVVAAPVLRAAQYALATADLVSSVFDGNGTATAPDLPDENPWEGRDRVSVLLLGGDGGDGRDGVRTDSVILLSIDTRTGKAVTFSLPRNLSGARFPEGSPLADAYPYGFTNGDPADGNYMLNAIYRNVPAAHPGILGNSSNEGADAIKLAVEGTLGIPVDYYVLVNLDGFKQVVDAMGGVTVNINQPIAIGGDSSAGVPPWDYLEPGADQHLDGFHALWYSRGRWGSDDYQRMDRQRCMVDALVESADPGSLLLRYLDLVRAGKEIVYTDIPRQLGPAFADLALRVKGGKMKSVVFRSSAEFSSANPDFDYIHETVQSALAPRKRKAGAGSGDGEGTSEGTGAEQKVAEDPVDVCAYNPTGETVEDALARDAAYR